MGGFRTSSDDGGRAQRQFATGQSGVAPFSQAQILHLMKTEFARGRRYGFPLACVLMQVDRLQTLADIHGTELVEVVRAELVRLVKAGTRGADQLGFINDDRYLLVMPHTDEADSMVVAERIYRNFGDLEVTVKGSVLAMSLSLGVVSCSDRDTLFFDTMLSRAEAALSWALDSGGDRIEVFAKDRLAE